MPVRLAGPLRPCAFSMPHRSFAGLKGSYAPDRVTFGSVRSLRLLAPVLGVAVEWFSCRGPLKASVDKAGSGFTDDRGVVFQIVAHGIQNLIIVHAF